jgi:hypothetical protein
LPKVRPDLKSKLEEFSQNPESQHEVEFEVGGNNWKFIANKENRVGDFRLVRNNEEEAMIVIRQERPNTFAYWNKSFAVSSGRKIFRGPNEPAAQKIRVMITKLAKDSLS